MGPEDERSVEETIKTIRAGEPVGRGRWAYYRWHRYWRRQEYLYFISPRLEDIHQWTILKEALRRIGGFW